MSYSKSSLQKANFEYYKQEIESVRLETYLHNYLDKLNYDIKQVSKLGNLTKEQKSKLLELIRKKKAQMKREMKKLRK
ncbi:hypothetical protein DRO54_10040 [Candidatus Bathyarchaeota archaeon]|nr:MAG: hypothetical protein DRO54_10040 [Candidatus Bathyarchaeota archaeon]